MPGEIYDPKEEPLTDDRPRCERCGSDRLMPYRFEYETCYEKCRDCGEINVSPADRNEDE